MGDYVPKFEAHDSEGLSKVDLVGVEEFSVIEGFGSGFIGVCDLRSQYQECIILLGPGSTLNPFW